MERQKELEIMAATVQSIKNLLEKRLRNKLDALDAISTSSLDNIPEVVQMKREEEASKIRAVVQEQKDLIEIINVMFPD
ncbi:hypothetical protein K5I29_02335 [Flavobacterium agricola]|uniref:Uncharacterized protein n=1 Tax=Flavobacterium agricola TaxID=2870839 RepID=A0ABY6M341_9FLAO|nr:hypothetical protein [Flavobacterium agricola]UYW01783.1 hypothetical protein K5I29_02335 [Flavobacterium agricola]